MQDTDAMFRDVGTLYKRKTTESYLAKILISTSEVAKKDKQSDRMEDAKEQELHVLQKCTRYKPSLNYVSIDIDLFHIRPITRQLVFNWQTTAMY